MKDKERIDANNEIARQLKVGQKVMIFGKSRQGFYTVECVHKGQVALRHVGNGTTMEIVPCRFVIPY